MVLGMHLVYRARYWTSRGLAWWDVDGEDLNGGLEGLVECWCVDVVEDWRGDGGPGPGGGDESVGSSA
jgi:hypothetical protein